MDTIDGYLGNHRLKKIGVDLSYTQEQVSEIVKCTEDPIYFIKTYVKIVNVKL
jgi:ribonucleotide reductase beta subunit family protein with ferritin-like domain